jgi:hypothetical protein
MELLQHGQCFCVMCGAALDLPDHAVPTVVIVANPSRPTVRRVFFGGIEVHRCELDDLNAA